MTTQTVKSYKRAKPGKKQADRQHAMTTLLRREIELAKALNVLNAVSGCTDRRQHRTPAQSAMLAGIPPITAFMGMEG